MSKHFLGFLPVVLHGRERESIFASLHDRLNMDYIHKEETLEQRIQNRISVYLNGKVQLSSLPSKFGAEMHTYSLRTLPDTVHHLTAILRFDAYYINLLFFETDEDFYAARSKIQSHQFRGLPVCFIGPSALNIAEMEHLAKTRETPVRNLGVFEFPAATLNCADLQLCVRAKVETRLDCAPPIARLTDYICDIVKNYPAVPSSSDPFLVRAHADIPDPGAGYISVKAKFEYLYEFNVLVCMGQDTLAWQRYFAADKVTDSQGFNCYSRKPTFQAAAAAAVETHTSVRVVVVNVELPLDVQVLRSVAEGNGEDGLKLVSTITVAYSSFLRSISHLAALHGHESRQCIVDTATTEQTGFVTVKFVKNACIVYVVFQRGRFEPEWEFAGLDAVTMFDDDGFPVYAQTRTACAATEPRIVAALRAIRKLTPAQRETLRICQTYGADTL